MFKLVIVAVLVAAVSAGELLTPVAPAYHVAPVLHAPLATSYANTYKVSVRAPLVHTAPVAYAAAPALAYPYVYGKAYGYGYHY